jgi:hypothetical protein
MHRHFMVVLVLAVAGACSDKHPGAKGPTTTTAAVPTTTSTAAAGVVSVEGEVVRGAAVTVSSIGLAARAGNEVSVLVQALDDESYNPGAGGVVGPDGTVRITTFVTSVLNHEGPCRTTAPCDLLPVTIGRYWLSIVGEGMTDVLARGELTVVAARHGVEYQTIMNNECGPPRVDFDGTVWVRATPELPAPWDPKGTPGSITVRDRATAAFRSDKTGDVIMKPADAATMATVGCRRPGPRRRRLRSVPGIVPPLSPRSGDWGN